MKRALRGYLIVLGLVWGTGAQASSPEDTALAQWYEQARSYYSAVQNGAVPKPDPGAWQDFLTQMEWARQQLGAGSDWKSSEGVYGGAGNFTHKASRTRLLFAGKTETHDIWSNDVILDVASVSAKVAVETTTDTSIQPPKEVIKITVSDPANGARSEYFVHDVGAAVVVNAPNPHQVKGLAKSIALETRKLRKPGLLPGFPQAAAALRSPAGLKGASDDVPARLENALSRLSEVKLEQAAKLAEDMSYEELAWAVTQAAARMNNPATAFDSAAIEKAIAEATPASGEWSPEQKVKIHMILLQIMMGDLAGALRSYAVLMDRDMRMFTRLVVEKLERLRATREQILQDFAKRKPPRAYAGPDPSQAARAQDRSAKYTQFVQMSTQLRNELQSTERELVDALQSQFRSRQEFWESIASFRDSEFRTNERVMIER
jgi:hypothetical protein